MFENNFRIEAGRYREKNHKRQFNRLSKKIRVADFQRIQRDHLLQAVLTSKSKSVIVGCRGGGSGVCKVQILSGRYNCQKMSRDHICTAEQDQGIVLACRTYPQSDISFKAAQPKFLKAIHKRKCVK